MSAASAQPAAGVKPGPQAIRFNLTLPHTRMTLGSVTFDPIEHFLGTSVRTILASLLVGEPSQRAGAAGGALDVYPLHLPAGEGAFFPLKAMGELGLFNDRGLLRLTVPLQVSPWIAGRFGSALVRGPEVGLAADRQTMIANAWIRLHPGMRAALPLGSLGELGVEAS